MNPNMSHLQLSCCFCCCCFCVVLHIFFLLCLFLMFLPAFVPLWFFVVVFFLCFLSSLCVQFVFSCSSSFIHFFSFWVHFSTRCTFSLFLNRLPLLSPLWLLFLLLRCRLFSVMLLSFLPERESEGERETSSSIIQPCLAKKLLCVDTR